ncbi:MAG: hypothetical protein IJK28_05015 [Clostridia bacterium]|nr:hypothetical protein [Clostridia bacterium]
MKRKLFFVISLILLAALIAALPAQAAPATGGCTSPKAPGGKHNWVARSRDPWCETPGGIVWVCTYCHKEVFEETKPPLGHDWGGWFTVSEGDCTHAGQRRHVCNRCNKVETQTTGFGHKWGEWTQDEPGTCIKRERLVRKCTLCGMLHYADGEFGEHDWDEWKVVAEPTATEDGLRRRLCKNDAGHFEEEAIPAGGATVEPGGPYPSLHLDVAWADDAGEGKRYEGAEVRIAYRVSNIGNRTVYVDSGDYAGSIETKFPRGAASVPGLAAPMIAVHPGERWYYADMYHVTADEVESGLIQYNSEGVVVDGAVWIDDEGQVKYVGTNHGHIHIPLTYPDGMEPEEPNPQLTIQWHYDEITHNGVDIDLTEPGTLAYPDSCFAYYSVNNTGNVPLNVVSYAIYGNGETFKAHLDYGAAIGAGGHADSCWGSTPISRYMTPGTETDELFGIVTLSFYCAGYAPEGYESSDNPGEELCRTETVTRIWKIGKDDPWEIPEESDMEVEVTDSLFESGWNSFFGFTSDPAGYQLGEYWVSDIIVKNTGGVDLNYTVHKTVKADSYSGGGDYTAPLVLAAGDEDSLYPASAPMGNITEADVARGYIEVSASVTWTDPDSGVEHTAYSNVWHKPVISKTGLLLQKKASEPANGKFFVPGEPIHWTLTVTNNSNEPVRDVTVMDQGTVVGTFAEIPAGKTVNCTVPDHVVTEYEAQVTGCVINNAYATGTDLRGAEHSWPSNPAVAECGMPDTPPAAGAKPGLTAEKTDLGPLNGEFYEQDEEITFLITVTNTGDCELTDLRFYDSMAGTDPVDTLASLPAAGTHTFTFKYTVKAADMDHPTLTNGATVTCTSPDAPVKPAHCVRTVRIGDGDPGDGEDDPPFDPEKLQGGGDSCSLTLEALTPGRARYTLHACAEHTPAAQAAEAAGLAGDWAQAAGIWQKEIDGLYEKLFDAAGDEARAVLLREKASFDAYSAALGACAGDAALAEHLRLRCAALCCMIRTAPFAPPSALVANPAMSGTAAADNGTTARTVGPLDGSDAAVTETYAGRFADALGRTLETLGAVKSVDRDKAFARSRVFWQTALDDRVSEAYKAADRERRGLIAAWRKALDGLVRDERDFLALFYAGNPAVAAEQLMNLFRDAGFLAVGME